MLYVTTRNDRDAFTALHAIKENRGADGGAYLPFHAPKFSPEEIASLAERPFGQRIADILNLLFKTSLTSWDVEFCIGRYPVRLEALGHRIEMAEFWHNPDWNYDRLVNSLAAMLCKEQQAPGGWIRIAIRIAVMFGIFGELQRLNITEADISVVSGDFSAPISAWYARKWGLPIGNIICCCNENNGLWDLVCHGQIRTDTLSIPTFIPEADVTLPAELERLVYECGGNAEVEHYLDACRRGGVYCPSDLALTKLRNGLFVSVVSSQRVKATIPSVYRTHNYIMSPYSALAYAGLQDYRVKTGITRHAIVIADKSPICDAQTVARAMGITIGELKKIF